MARVLQPRVNVIFLDYSEISFHDNLKNIRLLQIKVCSSSKISNWTPSHRDKWAPDNVRMCSCYFLLQIATGLQEAPDEISQHPRLSICWVWQIQINNLMMRQAGLSRWSGFWPHFECRSMMRMQQNSRWTWYEYDTVDFERHSMIRRQRLCRVTKCLQRAWWTHLESSSSIFPPLIARSWSKHCFHKKHFSMQEAYPCNETDAMFKLLERTQLIKTLFPRQ